MYIESSHSQQLERLNLKVDLTSGKFLNCLRCSAFDITETATSESICIFWGVTSNNLGNDVDQPGFRCNMHAVTVFPFLHCALLTLQSRNARSSIALDQSSSAFHCERCAGTVLLAIRYEHYMCLCARSLRYKIFADSFSIYTKFYDAIVLNLNLVIVDRRI